MSLPTEVIKVVETAIFLFVLLNPFLLCIYLLDLVERMGLKELGYVLLRASIISGVVFWFFAWTGDALLQHVLHVRFAAFMIFGGLVFFVIGIQFVLSGGETLEILRGKPEHLVGSVAMPFMIGPGTVSACVVAGTRSTLPMATLAILAALVASSLTVLSLKVLHDYVKQRNTELVERYINIVGRLSGLVIGTIAVEMILQGIETWLGE